jgi:2-methylisoborneol synthase
VLSAAGSPELKRFLAGVWAWMGGSHEWHATSARYHGASPSPTEAIEAAAR